MNDSNNNKIKVDGKEYEYNEFEEYKKSLPSNMKLVEKTKGEYVVIKRIRE